MPRKYEAIRDKLKTPKSKGGKGLSDLVAKQRAARIYNATRKPGQKPVTRKGD